MTEAVRKIHGKSPDKRFALIRPLFQRGLKDDIRNHNAVILAKAGMTMLFDNAFPRIIACGSQNQ